MIIALGAVVAVSSIGQARPSEIAAQAVTRFEPSAATAKISQWVIDRTANNAQAEFFVVLTSQADLAPARQLSLKVEKFGDRTLDQLRKEIPKTASMCDQPLKLTASGGGTLTEASIFGPGGGYWVFTKEKK